MCGLVGLFNKYTNGFQANQQEIFSSLLLVDYFRGPDSTGVFSVENNGDLMMAKEASNPIDFMKSKPYDEIMKKVFMSGSAIIGHNRKATRGTVNDENAHPFVVDDNIVLVHNGTMYGDHKKHAEVEVDSHAIAHVLSKEPDVAKALGSFSAAYALIWYDFKNGTINLIRNNDRPLWWMETASSWIWSSEKAMLDFVAARHNLTVIEGPNELPVDTLQTYRLENRSWEVDSQKLKITRSYGVPATNHGNWPYQQGWQGGPSRGSQRHPYEHESAWEDFTNGQDIPFDSKGTVPSSAAPSVGFVCADKPGTTPYEEMKIARKANKLVNNVDFHNEVILQYPMGRKVIASAFDYTLANQTDTRGGYYLYLEVVDDPDMVVRVFFDEKAGVSEERIMQMAAQEYVYEVEVGKKRWAAYHPGRTHDLSAGFVIIHAEKATLKWGGGIGEKKYAKAGKVTMQ